MNYIVFDLEWNQCPGGKRYSDRRLPFEIIEIGAVKLNENRETVDTFHRLIKPKVYGWIHDSIHEVIHVDYKDLENGTPFEQAAAEFMDWCGPEKKFFTWGNQDLMELQRNMKYYGLLSLIPGPAVYYDVQKIFGIIRNELSARRSLEFAVEELHIPQQDGFHRALADAGYTAEVLRQLDMKKVFENFSVDVYQNPKRKEEEVYFSSPRFEKFISREFDYRDSVLRDREVSGTICPACHRPAKRKIRWFSNHSRIYESVAECKNHGLIRGRIRIRSTEEEKYFAVKELTFIDKKEAEDIRLKRDALRLKRQMKRQSDKSQSDISDC